MSLLEALPFDSELFGRRVARTVEGLEVGALRSALEEARSEGFELVYDFRPSQGEAPSAELLDAFGGARACTQVRFEKPLLEPSQAPPPAGMTIDPEPKGEPAPELVELVRFTSQTSRFARDERLPVAWAERLYAVWIARSTRHEIANAVLVARLEGVIVGFMSVVMRGEAGEIGIVAVRPDVRGVGLGHALIDATERTIVAQGGRRMDVVTQRENGTACRLYRRVGFDEVGAVDAYHYLT